MTIQSESPSNPAGDGQASPPVGVRVDRPGHANAALCWVGDEIQLGHGSLLAIRASLIPSIACRSYVPTAAYDGAEAAAVDLDDQAAAGLGDLSGLPCRARRPRGTRCTGARQRGQCPRSIGRRLTGPRLVLGTAGRFGVLPGGPRRPLSGGGGAAMKAGFPPLGAAPDVSRLRE